MIIAHRYNGKTLEVTLQGELDHHTAVETRERLDALLAGRNVQNVILDLSKLTFMDSSGIGVLIGRYKLVHRKGGHMAVRGVPSQVDRVLELSGVYQIIDKAN